MKASKKTKDVILNLADRIREEYKPEKIILYGSYAYGEPRPDSDIDFLIVKNTQKRPIDRRVEVRKKVSDLRRGYPFSSLVITPGELNSRLSEGDQFIKKIMDEGEVLYAT